MAKIGNLQEVGSRKLQVFEKQTFLYFFTFSHAFRTRFLKNFHLSSFPEGENQKFFKRAQTMLQSWLIFTSCFSFHLKLQIESVKDYLF